MLKVFKNGNVLINLADEIKEGYLNIKDLNWIDNFYNNELTMNDFYFNQINGYMYLVNYRLNLVYDFSNCFINVLADLKEELMNNNFKLKIYPLSKKVSKSLIQDMENGY